MFKVENIENKFYLLNYFIKDVFNVWLYGFKLC